MNSYKTLAMVLKSRLATKRKPIISALKKMYPTEEDLRNVLRPELKKEGFKYLNNKYILWFQGLEELGEKNKKIRNHPTYKEYTLKTDAYTVMEEDLNLYYYNARQYNIDISGMLHQIYAPKVLTDLLMRYIKLQIEENMETALNLLKADLDDRLRFITKYDKRFKDINKEIDELPKEEQKELFKNYYYRAIFISGHTLEIPKVYSGYVSPFAEKKPKYYKKKKFKK